MVVKETSMEQTAFEDKKHIISMCIFFLDRNKITVKNKIFLTTGNIIQHLIKSYSRAPKVISIIYYLIIIQFYFCTNHKYFIF